MYSATGLSFVRSLAKCATRAQARCRARYSCHRCSEKRERAKKKPATGFTVDGLSSGEIRHSLYFPIFSNWLSDAIKIATSAERRGFLQSTADDFLHRLENRWDQYAPCFRSPARHRTSS